MFVGLYIKGFTLLFLIVLFSIYGTASWKLNCLAFILLIRSIFLDQLHRVGRLSQRHIPRVPSWPLIGPLPYVSPKYLHESLMRWVKELGPVFRIPSPGGQVVFANSYEAIRDVCITQARGAGGRPKPFLTGYMLNGTGILFSHQPDHTWKSLRMASQRHLKQFGDGLSHLEHVINDVAEEMFTVFDKMSETGTVFDPKQTVFDAALNTVAFLITGVRNQAGDELVEKMREYEGTVVSFIGNASDIKFADYDIRPWVRHLNLETWKIVEGVKKLQQSIWSDVQDLSEENPEAKSLFKVLMAQTCNSKLNSVTKSTDIEFSEDDVKMTIMSLLLAGVTTTSASFYSMLNILAHRPDVQEKLHVELKRVTKTNEPVTLMDRQEMPYCRAVVYELLRYSSVVPLGVPHRTIQEVEIAGVKIPAETTVSTNLWAMHHDPDFWTEPYVFNPERFLDENGELVLADHPNRKHLMPFGAGARVCLGESLALARLFLWIASFSQRYQIYPAEDNQPEKCDARNYHFDGVIRVCPYNARVKARNTFEH